MQLAFALLIMSSSLRLFSADSNIRKREEEGIVLEGFLPALNENILSERGVKGFNINR